MVNQNSEKKSKVPQSYIQQSNCLCWPLENVESTIEFGITLTRKFPNLEILLLQGPLGAGKTTLVKGIAKSLGIEEPITSPTFPLAQHYLSGRPPLLHLDLYRLDDSQAANELFLQEEEEMRELGGIMVIEWPERLSLELPEAWQAKIDYIHNEVGRSIELQVPKLRN